MQVGIGIDQHPLHRLTLGQFFTERGALPGIGSAEFKTALDHTDAARPVADAPGADPVLGELEAFALAADHVFNRNTHVLERDLPGPVMHHGFLGTQQFDTGRIHVDEEGRDTAAGAFFPVCRRDHLGEIGLGRAGDISLHTVDDVVIAVADSRRAHPTRVATGLRLCLRKAVPQFSLQHRIQVALFLFVIQVIEDGADDGAENIHVARRQRDCPRQFRPDNGPCHQPEPLTAVFFRHVEQPQAYFPALFLKPCLDFGFKLMPVEAVVFDRDQFAIDETANSFLQHAHFFG